jgi:putative alpha-1,2-mannosidase
MNNNFQRNGTMVALVCAVNLSASVCLWAADEAAQWVDPRIGTQNGGNVIIGPSLPFGMVKPGPDTGAGDQNSGYAFGEPIVGFRLGYCSIERVDRPGSKTMEYAQDDFSIAEMAAVLGYNQVAV